MSRIRNVFSTRRHGRRGIRGVVLLAGLLGGVAALGASGVPANAAPQAVTAGTVRAISSFYDPFTGNGSGGSLYVFSATPSGVWQTYRDNTGGAPTNIKINNLTTVTALSSFYDPYTGDGSEGSLHVFSLTPGGVYQTVIPNNGNGPVTRKIVNLQGVTAISSFFDPYTADGSGGSLHVFWANTAGVHETYWFNTNSTKHIVAVNTLAGVTAISSFFDPYTADGSGGSLHVFAVNSSGVHETYWFNTGSPKNNDAVNTLAGVTAISSFFDPYTADGSGGSLHVFAATPSGDWETYWFNTGSPKTTDQINNL